MHTLYRCNFVISPIARIANIACKVQRNLIDYQSFHVPLIFINIKSFF